MNEILVFGAGGHAKVIIDILENQKMYKVKAIVDREASTKKIFGHKVISQRDFKNTGITQGVIAVGDNWVRQKLEHEILALAPNFKFVVAIHPQAIVSKHSEIGPGSVIMASAVVNPGTVVGRHCIINTRSAVDHDCRLEDFSSLAPGCTIGGTVSIGKYSAIGIGATISHNLQIGEHTVIGAGSVVVRPIGSHVTAYGSPCRNVRERKPGEWYL